MLIVVILIVLFLLYNKRNEFFGEGDNNIKNQIKAGFARISSSNF